MSFVECKEDKIMLGSEIIIQAYLKKGSKWSFDSLTYGPYIKVWNHSCVLFLTEKDFVKYFVGENINYKNIEKRVKKGETQWEN